MELSKLLTPERMRVPLTAGDKRGLITELVSLLAESGAIANQQAVLDAVLKREMERSTGIGYGLAIPHGKSEGCTQLVMAAGKPETPVEYQSVDGRPVNFIVLLVSPPDQTANHIQALAKISRIMNVEAFRASIPLVSSAQELHELIRRHEG
ncbi:MAG: PTS system fructose-specific EIIABC component [Phycisphaerae bacterium]|nr:PTS system fructose-specific EIIABC component [Phycisphaerae bacterium]